MIFQINAVNNAVFTVLNKFSLRDIQKHEQNLDPKLLNSSVFE